MRLPEFVWLPVTENVPPTLVFPETVRFEAVVVASVAVFVATRFVVVAVLLTTREPVVRRFDIVADAADRAPEIVAVAEEMPFVMEAESAESAPLNVPVVPVRDPETVVLPVTFNVPPTLVLPEVLSDERLVAPVTVKSFETVVVERLDVPLTVRFPLIVWLFVVTFESVVLPLTVRSFSVVVPVTPSVPPTV